MAEARGVMRMSTDYEMSELASALLGAQNLNSALKNFLKNEVQKGHPAAKFIKALRGVASSSDESALEEFLVKHNEKI